MHPQLAALVTDLESASERVHRLHRSLSFHAWSARPASDRWSAAECIAHLNLTSEALLPLVRRALQQARDRQESKPSHYRRDARGWLAWKIIAPESGVKIKTTAPFVPSGALSADSLLSEFTRLQGEVISCIRDADGLPLERVKVRSPFHGRMAYNVYAAFTLVPRHQHRHLDQAERAAQTYAPLATTVAV